MSDDPLRLRSTATWSGETVDGSPSLEPRPAHPVDAGEAVAARYVLAEELGRGGMAVVHAAFDRQLARRVAVKLLHPGGGGHGGNARLVREAQALAQLRHPNVVTVFDAGSHDGQMSSPWSWSRATRCAAGWPNGGRGARWCAASSPPGAAWPRPMPPAWSTATSNPTTSCSTATAPPGWPTSGSPASSAIAATTTTCRSIRSPATSRPSAPPRSTAPSPAPAPWSAPRPTWPPS